MWYTVTNICIDIVSNELYWRVIERENRMYRVELKNCNSILNGEIAIEPNKLNVKYGINGTGKTTISKAMKLSNDAEKLQDLKSYFATEPASISIAPSLNSILVFDEDFVSKVVFRENEVIENSFEVFLKTPNYDAKKEKVDNRLLSLHSVVIEDEEILAIKELLINVSGKFKRTRTGKLSKTGAFKSLLSKQNIYNVPKELTGYQSFFENKDINIPWIDWKNKGDDYDIGDKCPYCTEKIDRPLHDKRKQIFKSTYTKADSQNLKDILELLESLEDYITAEKYANLITYIKDDTPEDVIDAIIDKLTVEVDLLIKRFDAIENFGQKKLVITDIANIELQIREMLIPDALFEIFGGDKTNSVFSRVNEKVNMLLTELGMLKKEMGELKGIMNATIAKSQEDINEFLKTAGINYELVIIAEDETNSKAILKQCFSEDKTEVTKIRNHLSWGEKNAFSLILFMYYANMQNPDLIILDDPISSFDSNKKYAILHRMFKNIGKRDVSLKGKTVLLLTHDFEPITDFLVVGKLDSEQAVASFIWNSAGIVKEKYIDVSSDIKLITNECATIASDTAVNIVSRIAFLRKLCELNECKGKWGYAYEILSCLIHAKEIKRKIANEVYIDLDESEKQEGFDKIREYIPGFEYNDLKNDIYTLEGIKQIYLTENNAYLKMQLFRAMKEVAQDNDIKMSPMDSAWFKFIDETYHIENDYLHYLDILKFNIVPDYIVSKVDNMVANL